MDVYDTYQNEYAPYATRQGRPIKFKNTGSNRPLLVWELRALALCSSKLRRLDFRESITRRRKGGIDFANPRGEGQGCGIVEALMPLCRRGYTNVDWFDLTGIELMESDLDWLGLLCISLTLIYIALLTDPSGRRCFKACTLSGI